MDSKNIPNTPENNKGRITTVWQWLTHSQTRIIGVIILGFAFVLILALMVLLTQQSAKKKVVNIPQATPTAQPTTNTLSSFPSPSPDQTKDWLTLKNINGFEVKYPKEGLILPDIKEATQSSIIQILPDKQKEATSQASLIVEVVNKDLKQAVESLREKNASQKILTKPISILIFGSEGYEWYFQGAKASLFNKTVNLKDGKNRVIQFNKNNKHFVILSSFDDNGELLLSTVRFTK